MGSRGHLRPSSVDPARASIVAKPSPQHLHAVASAVYVAVTRDLDHLDGGDDPVSAVTDVAGLKRHVESYLDGYEVSDASLSAAVAEGPGLTADKLRELISQAAEVGIDRDEFFEDGEFDIDAGLAAAAGLDPAGSTPAASVRERVFAELRKAEDEGVWLFIDPSQTHSSVGAVECAYNQIKDRGRPDDTSYIGWGRDRDHLRPDGTFARGEDSQEIFWFGDEDTIRETLRRVEPLGFVVEDGENGTRFRLVSRDDASSPEPFALPQRDDLVPQAGGAQGFRYARSFVEKTHLPKSDDDQLVVALAEVQELYDGGAAVDIFVLPELAEGELPAWSMKIRPKKKVVVTHYHQPSGSAARIIELDYSPMSTNLNPNGSLTRSKARPGGQWCVHLDEPLLDRSEGLRGVDPDADRAHRRAASRLADDPLRRRRPGARDLQRRRDRLGLLRLGCPDAA